MTTGSEELVTHYIEGVNFSEMGLVRVLQGLVDSQRTKLELIAALDGAGQRTASQVRERVSVIIQLTDTVNTATNVLELVAPRPDDMPWSNVIDRIVSDTQDQ